jgi:cell fate regulator YaaT (PSP1 superfamily)
VGIRDFSQFFNQIGICGRPFCCSTVKTHKNSISLKMAKEQNLHINASKLSGVCGRLMCCLNYEYDSYKEAMDYPAIGDEIFLKKQTYFVKEVDYNKKVIYVFNESEEYEEMTLDQYQHLKCEKCKR